MQEYIGFLLQGGFLHMLASLKKNLFAKMDTEIAY